MKSEMVSYLVPIQSVEQYAQEEGDRSFWKVGWRDCTAIEAYEEPGEYSGVPFLRIFLSGELRIRVPALHCTITYAKAPVDE